MARKRTTRKLWKLLPIARAIAVLSAVGLITTAVTFAAIQSNGNVLTGNTIQTATAALQISTDGSSYDNDVPGFTFSGLVPGGKAQSAAIGSSTVYLKNNGTSALTLALTIPTPPTLTGTVDLAKVSLQLVPLANTNAVQTIPLASLTTGQWVSVANSSVAKGAVVQFHLQVVMDADAVSGNGATISNLNLSFSGTPVITQ
jgi:hypothetical protein